MKTKKKWTTYQWEFKDGSIKFVNDMTEAELKDAVVDMLDCADKLHGHALNQLQVLVDHKLRPDI